MFDDHPLDHPPRPQTAATPGAGARLRKSRGKTAHDALALPGGKVGDLDTGDLLKIAKIGGVPRVTPDLGRGEIAARIAGHIATVRAAAADIAELQWRKVVEAALT